MTTVSRRTGSDRIARAVPVRRGRRLGLALGLTLWPLLWAVPALAGDAATGDTDGAALAQACFSCHGAQGRGGEDIPALAGGDADQFTRMMRGYADGSLPGTIMPRFAPSYTDDEIAALAAWFAEVTP